MDQSSEPFLLQGDRARQGALLVHGFTGTPREMRYLGEAIQRSGRAALGIRLAGHGGESDALNDTGWPDWLASCEQGLEELQRELVQRSVGPTEPDEAIGIKGQERGGSRSGIDDRRATPPVVLGASPGGKPFAALAAPRAHLVGFSLGGALALMLARRHPDRIASLTLISTPLWLPFYFRWPVALCGRFGWLRDRLRTVRKVARGDLRDPTERRNHVATERIPLRATESLVELLEQEVRPHLETIGVPALVIHSRRDHAIPFACSHELARRLPRAEHLPLARSYHIVPLDLEREVVAERMLRFQSETEESSDAEIRAVD